MIPTAGKLACRPLAPDEILRAYPIVSAIEGCAIGPKRWQEIVQAWLEGAGAPAERRGIRVVGSERGYLYGLFFHRVADDLRHGRVLDVSQLRVLEIGHSDRALRVALEAAENLARAEGCHGMLIELLQDSPPPLAAALLPELARALGFRPHCLRLFRPLAGPPPVLAFPAGARQARLGR